MERYPRLSAAPILHLGMVLFVLAVPRGVCLQSSGSETELLQAGGQALHEGRLTEAEARFREAVRRDPQMPEAHLWLGMALLRQGQAARAEDSLERALALNPSLTGAHLFLGIAQYQANRLDAAVSSLEAEVQLQPSSVEALTWLGLAELARGRPDQAATVLDRASLLVPRDPNLLDLRARAHTMVAKQCYQELYNLDPASWHVHRALAEIYSAAGQPEQAAEEYRVALREQPNNADLYEALGQQYQRTNKLDEAAGAYERELQLNPHSAVALLQLGRIRVEKDDPAAGIALLRRAIEAHADPAMAYYFLGLGLAKSGDDRQAVTALQQCLTSRPPASIERGAWYALLHADRRLHRDAEAQQALAELNRLDAAAKARGPR